MFDETEELLEKRKEYFENLNCKEKNLIEKERFKKMCQYDNLKNLNPDYNAFYNLDNQLNIIY